MRPTGKMAAAAAVALAQSYHSYQEMDCQALIEQAVRNVGGQMDYRGSNDMARNAAWLGTLENARAEGKLAPGRCCLSMRTTKAAFRPGIRGTASGTSPMWACTWGRTP